MKLYSRLVALLGVLSLSGCAAQMPPGNTLDPRDPYEAFNRTTFEFNEKFDRAVFKPVAIGYREYVPSPVRMGLGNFFGNLGDILTTGHHLLQGDGGLAGQAAARVTVNTTIGVLGFFDVASPAGLTKTKEDAGQTLGRWGSKPGAYLVLPFFGPSSARDAIGTLVDTMVDPVGPLVDLRPGARYGRWAVRVVDTRAGLLDLENMLDTLAFDRYLAVRDAYLARREQQVGIRHGHGDLSHVPY